GSGNRTFFWGYLERHTNRLAHNTKAALINNIMKRQEVGKGPGGKGLLLLRAGSSCVIDAEGGWITE
ncbi:Hypothetical protein FKW44_006131, partial [Caligus rogercresseyi]